MRERFLVLDGLRGIAALTVLTFHVHGRPHWLAGNAFLAVDFFFMLSGFVLAHAYGDRLGEPGAGSGFLRERIIRLHPLLLLAIIPGAVATTMTRHAPTTLPTIIAGAIPFPALWHAPLPKLAFPLNPPSWSLFWELVINILFLALLPRLRTPMLVGIVFAASVGMTLAYIFGQAQDGTLAIAGIRAFACFPAGMLLYRIHAAGRLDLRGHGWFAAPLFLAIMVVPGWFPIANHIVSHFLLFPLIILVAAQREAQFSRLCIWLGELSYPLYVLHLPLLFVAGRMLAIAGATMAPAAMALLTIPAAWAIGRWYDRPVRAWLRRRFGWRRPIRPAEA